jgi:hypothetical protein
MLIPARRLHQRGKVFVDQGARRRLWAGNITDSAGMGAEKMSFWRNVNCSKRQPQRRLVVVWNGDRGWGKRDLPVCLCEEPSGEITAPAEGVEWVRDAVLHLPVSLRPPFQNPQHGAAITVLGASFYDSNGKLNVIFG